MTGFQKGVRVATIAGIPVYLHVSWFVVFALVAWSLSQGYFPARYPELPVATYWAKGLSASLLLFASVLAHELGHSLVARRYGIGIVSITLFIFGGLANLDEDPQSPGAEFWVAVAGPAVSFALAGLFAGAAAAGIGGSAVVAVTGYLGFINLVLGLFNLIPAFPLDGGRVLRAALWRWKGRTWGTRAATTAGTAFAYFFIAYGILLLLSGGGLGGLWAIFIGWFIKEATAATSRQTSLEEIFADIRVGDVMVADCVTIPGTTTLEEAARTFFMSRGHGGFPVEKGGEIRGVISLADLRRVPREAWAGTTVSEVMSPAGPAIMVDADRDITTALRQMAGAGTGRLLVREGGRCVGMVTHGDILQRWQIGEALAGR